MPGRKLKRGSLEASFGHSDGVECGANERGRERELSHSLTLLSLTQLFVASPQTKRLEQTRSLGNCVRNNTFYCICLSSQLS